MFRWAGSMFLKLSLATCTRGPNISHCNAHYSVERCVDDSMHGTAHIGGVAASVVCRWAALIFSKLDLPIYTRRLNISHCNARYSLERCVDESMHMISHVHGVAALVVCRWAGSTSKKLNLIFRKVVLLICTR